MPVLRNDLDGEVMRKKTEWIGLLLGAKWYNLATTGSEERPYLGPTHMHHGHALGPSSIIREVHL